MYVGFSLQLMKVWIIAPEPWFRITFINYCKSEIDYFKECDISKIVCTNFPSIYNYEAKIIQLIPQPLHTTCLC